VFFSFAYRRIDTGVGALILFGAVQVTMLGVSVWRRAHSGMREWIGGIVALAGLAALTLPGKSAPDAIGSLMMATAGIGWGVYSLPGRLSTDALAATTASFLRGSLVAIAVALGGWLSLASPFAISPRGIVLAAISGGLTSGVGYSLWYVALP